MHKRLSTNDAADRPATRERELLDATRRRNRGAFAELYQIYQPRLHGYLRRMVASIALVEEIIDDVMFIVWTDARKFRGDSAVSSWIFGIAYRKALTAVRRESRHQSLIDRNADANEVAAGTSNNLELVHAGLAELSPDHRQVVELTYFCGFSYQEIAEIADCPVNTVKTRMFHARRRLKLLLPRLAGEVKGNSREQA